MSMVWGSESQRKTSSPTDDSTSSPPIGSPASPPRVISAAQSRRSTLKNLDALKSALQAQQKSEDATDGSEVVASGGTTAAAPSNLEADLQLAGQIGEALLSENGKLETLVDELTTTLQAEYEAKQAVLEENEALRHQLQELSKLNAEMSSSAAANQFNSLSPVATGSPSHTMRTASRSPAKTPLGSRPRQLDTRTSGGGEEASIAFTLNELTGSGAEEPSGQEELINNLVAFLRSELGAQSNLARATPGSTTHISGGSAMIGASELRLNSPLSQHNGGGLTSPSHHERMISTGLGGSSITASASTFSTSPAAPLNPALMLEDLNAVLRKLRKERRVAELEKSNCAAMIAAMEKEVASAKAWVTEHQADVDSVASLRDQLEKLQKQLELSQSQAKEDAATASVEAKLKLQQAKRHLETSMKQLEEELRLDRLEAAALLAQRNELARRSNTLEQQLQLDQEILRQAQLENQTLKHSHAQLASLTSQLRDELERSMAEADSQIQARDAQIAAFSSSSSQGTQELVDLRRELARAESELASSTQAHIAQLAAISSGFDRKLEAEVGRAVAAVEQRAAEILCNREAELLAAQDAALMAQRASIEEQLESQRAETEQAIATQTAAFLEKQKLSVLFSNNEEVPQAQSREEIVLRLVDLSSPDASAAALHKKELGLSSELPSGLQSLASPQSTGTSSSSASDDGSLLSPISTFATSGSPPSSASVFSPAGSSCSSNRSSATPVHFNLSLKHLQLKFPATPSAATAAAVPSAASSSAKQQPPIVAPVSALVRSSPMQCCSETQTSPLPAANDSQISFSVDAPVAGQATATSSVSVLSPEPATSNINNRSSSPASRARLMESPMPGQNATASSSQQAFVAASPNKTNRHFHAMHSSAAATLSGAGALPPRSPAQPVRSTAQQQQQQAAESATQHRLALLSSVGKALSVVTGSSPVNTRVGSTPPAPIGRSPLTTSVSPSAPNVAAALSTAMTPKSSAAAKTLVAAAGALSNAGSGLSNSIYVLPLPPFAVSPSDQLALAYLYRYLHATWVQAFAWLQSSPCKDRALWIPDEMAGHCFSCQKHWTLTSRRHHCRCCGGLFCSTCSRFRLELPHSEPDSALVRCCLRCFGALQSMTMSNSLALWEQQGTLQPPPERSWIGASIVLGSPAAKVLMGRRGSSQASSSAMAPHSDATLPASAESSATRSTQAEVGSSDDDDDDEEDDSSDEYDSTDEDEDEERDRNHGAVLDDEHERQSRKSKTPSTQAKTAQAVERVPVWNSEDQRSN